MRNFTCRTQEGSSPAVEAMFIIARDEWRALELARRQLSGAQSIIVEICEAGQPLCRDGAPGATPLPASVVVID